MSALAECRDWNEITPADPWWRDDLTDERIDDRLDLCRKPCPIMLACRLEHMRGPGDERPIGVAGGLMFDRARNKVPAGWSTTPRRCPARPVLAACKHAGLTLQDVADAVGIDVVTLSRAQRSGQMIRSHASRIEWWLTTRSAA